MCASSIIIMSPSGKFCHFDFTETGKLGRRCVFRPFIDRTVRCDKTSLWNTLTTVQVQFPNS